MENNNKIYEKKARLYPVISAMLIPFILFVIAGTNFLNTYDKLEQIWKIVISIIPASLITAALGYGVKNLTRSTAKILFQFPLFKEDETRMPTTEILLHSSELLSLQNKQLIRNKISTDLGLILMDEEQEKLNEREARLIISDAVKRIREKTRGNQILFNYNCNYGFVRNFMGANVWSFIIALTLMIINFYKPFIDNIIIIGSAIFIVVLILIAFSFLKMNAREYARQLYTAFMEL
jgi:hypothetical protein